jgi:nitroreductase
MSLIEALKWRYATKKMNGEKVSQDKVDQILAAAHLAPTSSGLQPFKIIVVTNPELKEKIKAVAYGQSQVTDSSHLLILLKKTLETYLLMAIESVVCLRIHTQTMSTTLWLPIPQELLKKISTMLQNKHISVLVLPWQKPLY